MSDSNYLTLDPDQSGYANGNENLQDNKSYIMNSVLSAADSVKNNPTTQSLKDNVTQGPVAQSVKDQTAKTSSEFQDLANARTTPEQPAATGQPLTHYHSLFYRLLSWKNPRATAISYVTIILFTFAARYLPILRYVFKGLYIVLGITATAEIAGKMALGNGLTSQIRPRRYYVIPRESLERLLEDVEQFINFFVIEFQRILFAENIYATSTAFVAAFASYWLIKWLPLWGLSLIGTSLLYFCPLIYMQNQEFIDNNLRNAGNIINQQAAQVKELAAHHTGRASETVKTYAGEYGHKAQQMMGSAKTRAEHTLHPKSGNANSRATSSSYSNADFPNAPQQEPASSDPNQFASDPNRFADSEPVAT